jgi:hypothetical protein
VTFLIYVFGPKPTAVWDRSTGPRMNLYSYLGTGGKRT